MIKLSKLKQKGVIHLLPLLLVLVGIIAGVYLVQQKQIFKPEAGNTPISFQDEKGSVVTNTDKPSVYVRVSSTYPSVETMPVPTPTPTPAPTPVPTPKPVPAITKVTIRAWGQPANGNPKIALYDGNLYVTQFEVKATSKANAQELSFTFPKGKTFTQKPTIRFLNDYWKHPKDRNVYIDYIIVNNTKYETEDPKTYSDGSWTSKNGCAPGNKLQEGLHCNGYFRYDSYEQKVLGVGAGIYAKSFRIAEDKLDLDNPTTPEFKYSANDAENVKLYEFKKGTDGKVSFGAKFIFVRLYLTDGNIEDLGPAQIEYISPATPAPSSTPAMSVTKKCNDMRLCYENNKTLDIRRGNYELGSYLNEFYWNNGTGFALTNSNLYDLSVQFFNSSGNGIGLDPFSGYIYKSQQKTIKIGVPKDIPFGTYPTEILITSDRNDGALRISDTVNVNVNYLPEQPVPGFNITAACFKSHDQVNTNHIDLLIQGDSSLDTNSTESYKGVWTIIKDPRNYLYFVNFTNKGENYEPLTIHDQLTHRVGDWPQSTKLIPGKSYEVMVVYGSLDSTLIGKALKEIKFTTPNCQ